MPAILRSRRRPIRRRLRKDRPGKKVDAVPAVNLATMAGVEPTNNRAERALRGAVLWRKGCFGNQSAQGCRFTARILTAVATLRQQERNIGEYMVAGD